MTILKTDTVSGIGTEGTVFEGDITFDSLNYMTLPKGTTTQSNRGRAVFAGGYSTNIEYSTIATTGNATDFGSLTVSRGSPYSSSDSIRSVVAGGNTSPSIVNSIDYFIISTGGDAVDFGDLTSADYNGYDCISSAHGGL